MAAATQRTRPSPSSTLTLPMLVRILAWPIAHRRRRRENSDEPASASPGPPSPPASPRGKRQPPPPILTCSSGDEPRTHAQLVDANPTCRHEPIIVHVACEVRDGVNTKALLAYTRGKVLSRALSLGGDTLLNERWTCRVCTAASARGPAGQYKVFITYEGTAARTERRLPDPARPVCLNQAEGIPGLMTILSRESHYEKSTAKSTFNG